MKFSATRHTGTDSSAAHVARWFCPPASLLQSRQGQGTKETAITVRQGHYEIGRGKLGVREALPGSRGEYDARVQHLLNIALEAASMNIFSALLPNERN